MKSNEGMLDEILRQRDVFDQARHRRVKQRRWTLTALVLVLALAAGAAFAKPYLERRRAPASESTAERQNQNPADNALPSGSAAAKNVPYAALTAGASLPVYTGDSMACMRAFDETMLRGTAVVFAGTVLETALIDHTYVVRAPGKFGAETMTITTPLKSSLTTFRVDNVYHGNPALAGQTLTLEDKLFLADGQFGYRVGASYVLGAEDLGENTTIESLHGDETLLSGDLARRSRYATIYSACVPPIERTDKGDYIVADCWVSLTAATDADVLFDDAALQAVTPPTDSTTLPKSAQTGDAYVAMQPASGRTPEALAYYSKHMKLVRGADFEARFRELMTTLFSAAV